jgi:hypothetical protein
MPRRYNILNAEQREEIGQRAAAGENHSFLAGEYNVSKGYVGVLKAAYCGNRHYEGNYVAPMAHRPAVMPKVIPGITLGMLMAGK